MAHHSPLIFTLSSIIFLVPTLSLIVSATTTQTTSTVAKDQVPCTMCSECENPCYPLPQLPPPPPPLLIECPPPPSPPPPSPPPPSVVECPPPPKPACGSCETLPPPKPPCEGGDCLPSLVPPFPDSPEAPEYLMPPEQPRFPPGPSLPQYPPGYFPPGTPFPQFDDYYNNGAKIVPLQFLTFFSLLFLSLLLVQ